MQTVLEHILLRKLKSADALILIIDDDGRRIVVSKKEENRELYAEAFETFAFVRSIGDWSISRCCSGDSRLDVAYGSFGYPHLIELFVLWNRDDNDRESERDDRVWLKDNWNHLKSLITACRTNEAKEKISLCEWLRPLAPTRAAPRSEELIVAALTELFETTLLKRRVKAAADVSWDNLGVRLFQQRVRERVAQNLPLLFVLPAFPFKSGNTRCKVLGSLPDMGEKLGLQRLDEFLRAVERIYSPGARLLIFTDGRVYCDLFRISDRTTSAFKKAVRLLSPPSSSIEWTDLDEIFPDSDDNEKRVALLHLFGSAPERILQRIKSDVDFREVYNGFKMFMREELSFPDGWSNARIKKECGRVAKLMVQRTDAYQALIRCLFPDRIRLSIHPSTSVTKFSIDLVGKTDWGTPWHNCALLQPDGSWSLIRRATAESRLFPLVRSEDGLPYFVNNSENVFTERL